MTAKQSKSIKVLFTALIMFVILFAVTGCGSGDNGQTVDKQTNESKAGEGFPVTIVDSLDREVVIDSEPDKIVSMSPAITEILFAIGAEDKIVGVTDYCDYPAGALKKDKVGSFESPNVEMIVSIEPDIIFIAAGIQEDFVKQFESLGIKVIALDATTIDQVVDNIELAGNVCGVVKQASETVEDMKKRIAAVKTKIARAETRPSVFFEVWDDPLMTAGPGSFIDDMISLSGGKNIAADTDKKFVEFNREVLLSRNPDIYIINSHAHTPEDVKSRPGYGGLKAVQNNHVYSIEDDLVTLPGPRLVEGLEKMAKIIHPNLFK